MFRGRKVGVDIIKKALEEPVKQIALNAGIEGSVVVEKLKASEKGIGFDALLGEYGNMIEKGIVDPTKVTRSTLQNAANIAAMVLTTAGSRTPEKAAPAPQMPSPDMY